MTNQRKWGNPNYIPAAEGLSDPARVAFQAGVIFGAKGEGPGNVNQPIGGHVGWALLRVAAAALHPNDRISLTLASECEVHASKMRSQAEELIASADAIDRVCATVREQSNA